MAYDLKAGDRVRVWDEGKGRWFEGEIAKIREAPPKDPVYDLRFSDPEFPDVYDYFAHEFEIVKQRRYHVIVVRVDTRTGEALTGDRARKDYMTATPCTHDEACTIIRKCTPYRHPSGWGTNYRVEEVAA